jgi:hypothetical protein
MKHGVVCLSFDVEGMWGRKHLSNAAGFLPYIRRELRVVTQLLRVLERDDIKATWAVVGAMFGENKALIALLKRYNQEIACHSYTHADFSEIERSVADREIRKCIDAAKEQGVRLSSFIFPFHAINYLDALKRYRFTAFRGASHNLIDFISPGTVRVRRKGGLCDIAGSFYFPSNRTWGRFIPKGMRFFQAKKGIDRAVQTGTIFHLWTHPIDLIDRDTALLDEFTKILVYAGRLQRQGLLSIMPMKKIAASSA